MRVLPLASDYRSDHERHGVLVPHRFEYDTIYSGGGCILANLADRFGMDPFVAVLHDYAQAHWFGVTRTEDFKAAIEAAALADGVAFDPVALLGALAGGLRRGPGLGFGAGDREATRTCAGGESALGRRRNREPAGEGAAVRRLLAARPADDRSRGPRDPACGGNGDRPRRRAGRRSVHPPRRHAEVSIGGRKKATLGPGEFFGEIALLDGGPVPRP